MGGGPSAPGSAVPTGRGTARSHPRFSKEVPVDNPAPDLPPPQPTAEQPRPRKRSTNVPIPIVVGVICLGLGIAGGVVIGQVVNEQTRPLPSGLPEDDGKAANVKEKGGKNQGKNQGKFQGKTEGKNPDGKRPDRGQGGASKVQLTQLVNVLHTLTAKPPAFELSADEKKKLSDELAGLEEKEALTEQEAREKLTAITKILEPHKDALQAAGFLWPGQPPPGGTDANPLKGNERLKSLQSGIGK
jgi:hypothetical protein